MWKITILLCCLLGLSLSGAELLTEGGRSRYEIVLPADAVPAEQTAARELQSFLKQISGVELPIVASPSGPAIFIGQSPETASALGIPDWKRLKPDEIRLKSAGGNLYLAGDRPRGTLYAVYELLEKEFGVRFWTADATHVPKREKLELPQIDLRYAPPFEVRAAGYDLIRHDPRFSARTRNNGHGVVDSVEWGGSEQLLGGVHTFSENMPLFSRDKDFASHPEWFSERDGKRVPRQLCLSNPEMRKELTLRVLERLRNYPETRYISVSQDDNHDFCRCAACEAFVKSHGSQSDLLIDAINQVAAAVEKEFPGVYVETLAYYYTRSAPKRVRARRNVVVRYCTIEAASFHPLESEANRALEQDLQEWSRMADHFMIWNYVTDFTKYYQPHPNWHTAAPDLRFFRKCGAISIYEQGSWNGGGAVADLADLRAWLLSKLLWNPDLDTEKLMDEFVTGYYGPAAPAVKSYLQVMEQSARRRPDCRNTCYARSTAGWLEPAMLVQSYREMEQAYGRVKDDPVYGPRMAAATVPIRAALLERRELLSPPAGKRLPELQEVDVNQAAVETASRMKRAGVTRVKEGGLSPDEWAEQTARGYGVLPNDGERPTAAGSSPYHAWSIRKAAELHALGRELFWEKDPAASVGEAARMPNTHNEWHIQGFGFPAGTFGLYAELRCDSGAPAGNAIRVGTYDWSRRREFHRDIPAAEISGENYRAVRIGTVTLNDDICIFIAPVVNPAVRNVWIDRIILIPRKSGR